MQKQKAKRLMQNFQKDMNKFLNQNDQLFGSLMKETNANFTTKDNYYSSEKANKNVHILNMMEEYLSDNDEKASKVKSMKRILKNLIDLKE